MFVIKYNWTGWSVLFGFLWLAYGNTYDIKIGFREYGGYSDEIIA